MWVRGRHLVLVSTSFSFALAERVYFFGGFILGDDVEEFNLARYILLHGPDFQNLHMHLRFGTWVLNYLSFKLFGISELTFFLPTLVVSSLFGMAAYLLLFRWGYDHFRSFLGGLFVASAPFEVLLGTVHANDLWLSAALVAGLLALVFLERRPILLGAVLALCLWFGFYVKLWAIYLLPALMLYYAHGIIFQRAWRSPLSFMSTSLVLHLATGWYWKLTVGSFFPFLKLHSISYPIPKNELGRVFLQYPTMIFQGSEFGTTLFGAIPYVLVAILLVKALTSFLARSYPSVPKFDAIDLGLLLLYGSFFVLLNFFPNSFAFDRYYSLGRIFRYLHPLSFPMTLHLAKLLCDVSRWDWTFLKLRPKPAALTLSLFVPLIAWNLFQADEATKPGQMHRRALLAVLEDVRKEAPSKLLVEDWLGFWLRELYLKDEHGRISIVPIYYTYAAHDYEHWLQQMQTALTPGSMLVTGLANYVHYGAHFGGFRLNLFSRPLHPHWALFKEYGMLTYLPKPEPARLWRLSASIPAPEPRGLVRVTNDNAGELRIEYQSLFDRGLAAFENDRYGEARRYFQKILQEFPNRADDALHFYAASFYREGDWDAAIAEFGKLIRNYPQSHWVAGAHWHIGVSLRRLGNYEAARQRFEYVIASFPRKTDVVPLARQELESLPYTGHGVFVELVGRVRAAFAGR
jgi:tetratricopeptide (TPR) repeat protein